jgi:hypothetical protein
MSTVNSRNIGQRQITTDYDLSKIFVFGNRYENDNYVNNSNYNPLTLLTGTVMGRVTATNAVVPCYGSAVDGSQDPIGVLATDLIAIPGGSNVQNIPLCVEGDVIANKLIFLYGDTLDTIVNGKRMRDRIGSNSVGLKLVASTEMTDFDN